MTATSTSALAACLPPPEAEEFIASGKKLHAYLVDTHWQDGVIAGPDPGIRLNARLGRFIKSYASFWPWRDNLVYLQAQGYWIMDNWLMQDLWGDVLSRQIAEACSRQVLQLQRPEGYWQYPNPEWKHRIATVEGCIASLGLLDTFERVQDDSFLQGAVRWYEYVTDHIGFRRQSLPDMLAVNYFSHGSGDRGGVPNNSTMLVWLLARLAQLSGDERYLKHCSSLVNWLAHVQLPTGELPYSLGDGHRAADRIHFLCYQYNAFEFVDLVHYYEITADDRAMPILERLARYLSGGLTTSGCGRHSCCQDSPHVVYYTSAIAHALSLATAMGVGDYADASRRAYANVIADQRPDGGMRCYSERNYSVLSDRRSYPRYLAMILHHLLREAQLSLESGQ